MICLDGKNSAVTVKITVIGALYLYCIGMKVGTQRFYWKAGGKASANMYLHMTNNAPGLVDEGDDCSKDYVIK
jgi:hypothetical protein